MEKLLSMDCQWGESAFVQESTLPPRPLYPGARLWNKANFPFHQPCLWSTGFKVMSLWTTFLVSQPSYPKKHIKQFAITFLRAGGEPGQLGSPSSHSSFPPSSSLTVAILFGSQCAKHKGLHLPDLPEAGQADEPKGNCRLLGKPCFSEGHPFLLDFSEFPSFLLSLSKLQIQYLEQLSFVQKRGYLQGPGGWRYPGFWRPCTGPGPIIWEGQPLWTLSHHFWGLCCCCSVAQPRPTLCDPMDSSQPISCVQGILQARILEWVAITYSMDFCHWLTF